MIDYHKYIGYCRSDEKREKPVGGAGGRWDEEKPVENKLVENKPVESGGDYSTNSSIRSRDIEQYRQLLVSCNGDTNILYVINMVT